MAIFRYKSYTLREEVSEIGTRCFISFKDGQGEYHELEVSPAFYQEFRRLELNNRKFQNWDQLHREFSEVWDETLNRRARVTPKTVEETMIESERNELLYKLIAALPAIQKRRFLLYHEYDLTYCQIGVLEHCTPQSARRSVVCAREKIKAQMTKYLCA
jgi:DNA-directed RNA polymerase specialized sigma24 family protein